MSKSKQPLPDSQARERALDIGISCIVQAPAGSGKTELLTLRYLKLLSVSEEPEAVLAITFTRKAASEMRKRILETLQWAIEKPVPEKDFEELRLAIALKVIAKDQDLQWNLLKNPNRLRVQTIDSFCFYLANQLPVLSRIGGNPTLSEDTDHIYSHAVQNTLAQLDKGSALSDDVAMLLAHFDNNVAKVENLLVQLLGQRDQWAPHVLLLDSQFSDVQDYLIDNLTELINESVTNLASQFIDFDEVLPPLFRFSASNQINKDALWEEIELLTELPGSSIESLELWQKLADLFLTQKGEWRSRLDKKLGFPAGDKKDKEFTALCKQRKAEFSEVIGQLRENCELLELLNYIKKLPANNADSSRWHFLGALARVLIHMNGELLLSFANFGVMDYSQAGEAARMALGTEDAPTDLALTLDHKIDHILVDEFQDTSQLQLEILQMLTLGWDAADSRSLFLVGDAMQSCYGFRNANVGIYLNVQANGIGQIHLEPLILRSNFRSQENVVSWVNRIFSGAFPQVPNVSRGAVPYSHSSPIHEPDPEHGIETKIINHDGSASAQARVQEADEVVSRINDLRQRDPHSSIAILVRYRTHLSQIIPALKSANIPWVATDIDRLGSLPVIEDLLTLTKALVNPADSLSWYALLRAPYVGLTSKDLFALTSSTQTQSVWSRLQEITASDNQLSPSLSEEAYAYLTPFCLIMDYALSASGHISLRQLVEGTWTLLRGYELADNDEQLASAARYFELVSHHEQSQTIIDVEKFSEQVKTAFVSANETENSDQAVQILTMHKSKGLEFDHVILPSLSRVKASDDKRLLQWYERLNESGISKLFLSAQTATGINEDPLYQLIQYEQQQKSLYEDTRLLYIAVTRAKKSALLLGVVGDLEKETIKPSKNSLLARVWPQLENHNAVTSIIELESAQTEPEKFDSDLEFPPFTPIKRFIAPLALTDIENELVDKFKAEVSIEEETQELRDPDGGKAAVIGTLIHRSLEIYFKLDCPSNYNEVLKKQSTYWRLNLREVISNENDINEACAYIEKTLTKTLDDKELSWIFSNSSQDSQAELSLTTPLQKHAIVDRTFVDEQGVRWIIDFKTSTPKANQSNEEFLETMEGRYAGQLHNYANLFRKLEKRPIKLALLLTHLGRLHLIEAKESAI